MGCCQHSTDACGSTKGGNSCLPVTVKSRGRTQTETPHQMTLDVNLSGT
jgi:hypothetical protein